jgi:hypothetical protein
MQRLLSLLFKEISDMSIIEIVSLCVSVLGVIVAIWQTQKNSNIKKYIKSEAMEMYSDTAILLGNAQGCLREIQTNNINLVIQEAGKVEGLTQALFQRSIKNIHHHFDFTRKDVDEWIDKKKIFDFHKDSFLKYAEK